MVWENCLETELIGAFLLDIVHALKRPSYKSIQCQGNGAKIKTNSKIN